MRPARTVPARTCLPCSYNWPYQSINYSMGAVIGASDNTPTNNTRLAWGTNFGFLGQAAYHIHGSAYWGGPLPDATGARLAEEELLGVRECSASTAPIPWAPPWRRWKSLRVSA